MLCEHKTNMKIPIILDYDLGTNSWDWNKPLILPLFSSANNVDNFYGRSVYVIVESSNITLKDVSHQEALQVWVGNSPISTAFFVPNRTIQTSKEGNTWKDEKSNLRAFVLNITQNNITSIGWYTSTRRMTVNIDWTQVAAIFKPIMQIFLPFPAPRNWLNAYCVICLINNQVTNHTTHLQSRVVGNDREDLIKSIPILLSRLITVIISFRIPNDEVKEYDWGLEFVVLFVDLSVNSSMSS
ncbi:hypothetical protein EGR_10867 [Echinococcus granulosus]|uniref:Uncharacterized protein n=1 Tax=Echinococcus granulosus TaxID=6210 RepID=W6TZL7_ECHGR|nr:hypothetical protein EGR_10867 [Echinococcus granulosus]EUB54275.1 hypothetical protein EGR_10867 [Echinococcus granulosus]